jgi:hypothetical protein
MQYSAKLAGEPLADFLQSLSSGLQNDLYSAECTVTGTDGDDVVTVTLAIQDANMEVFDWLRKNYRRMKS